MHASASIGPKSILFPSQQHQHSPNMHACLSLNWTQICFLSFTTTSKGPNMYSFHQIELNRTQIYTLFFSNLPPQEGESKWSKSPLKNIWKIKIGRGGRERGRETAVGAVPLRLAPHDLEDSSRRRGTGAPPSSRDPQKLGQLYKDLTSTSGAMAQPNIWLSILPNVPSIKFNLFFINILFICH